MGYEKSEWRRLEQAVVLLTPPGARAGQLDPVQEAELREQVTAAACEWWRDGRKLQALAQACEDLEAFQERRLHKRLGMDPEIAGPR